MTDQTIADQIDIVKIAAMDLILAKHAAFNTLVGSGTASLDDQITCADEISVIVATAKGQIDDLVAKL